MPLIRPTALRSLQSSLRYSGARVTAGAAPARTQLVARRYASGGGHGDAHGEPSSDIPWIIGALVITPPSCWYLWPDSTHAEHHDDHAAHDDHAESGEGEEESKEEPEEEAAPAEEQGGDEKEQASDNEKPAEKEDAKDDSDDKKEGEANDESDDKKEGEAKDDSDDKKESKDKDDSSDKEESKDNEKPAKGSSSKEEKTEIKEQPASRGNVEGVNFKGNMKEDSAGQDDTRKLEPDPKGGRKKRLDSGLGKNLGVGSASDGEDSDYSTGIGKKQKNWSNTDTRHSMQIDEPGSEKSTKGSGGPETAKHKGTVDVSSKLK